MIMRLSTCDTDFAMRFERLLHIDVQTDEAVERTVGEILHRVRHEGDAAVLDYTRRFDSLNVTSVAALQLDKAQLQEALSGLPDAQQKALGIACKRIRDFHERQLAQSWTVASEDGITLGQKITALDRVGLYVPGGKAAYPSSVLMNAIPAQVAGVGELVMVVPTPRGERNALVLAAACVAGVDRVFTIGGAQAIGALAFGTQTVPQVDKIVGPGNAYVAQAKRRVFGTVGIDMIAGPSEVLIIADGESDPDWLAMDLFAQAEHDELAQSILMSPDEDLLERVAQRIAVHLPEMSRRTVINASLSSRGALILVKDMDEACSLANQIAPEHLELAVADPQALLGKIRHAGAIFLGRYASESLGDYCAGPNHVLPTSRSARFSSPLGVYDFQKRSSVIEVSASGAALLGPVASILARGEGLTAHARAAELRYRT